MSKASGFLPSPCLTFLFGILLLFVSFWMPFILLEHKIKRSQQLQGNRETFKFHVINVYCVAELNFIMVYLVAKCK